MQLNSKLAHTIELVTLKFTIFDLCKLRCKCIVASHILHELAYDKNPEFCPKFWTKILNALHAVKLLSGHICLASYM